MKNTISSLLRYVYKHKLVAALLVISFILVLSQVERIVHVGTLLGYKVRATSASTTNQNPFTTSSDSSKSHLACEKVTKNQVAKQLKTEVELGTLLLPDRDTPNIVSSCVYRTKAEKDQSVRSVTILIRDLNTDDAAKKTMTSLTAGRKTESIKDVGDEAVFVTVSNQLTARKGKRLVTITVTKAQSDQPDSKSVASQLAKDALK